MQASKVDFIVVLLIALAVIMIGVFGCSDNTTRVDPDQDICVQYADSTQTDCEMYGKFYF